MMGWPLYRNGKQLAVGEDLRQDSGFNPETDKTQHHRTDLPDAARPERPCALCGRSFQPTARRRMLCAGCFGRASSTME